MKEWPWTELGIEETADIRSIRRAYSTRMKEIDVDIFPERFIALREALEAAILRAENPDWNGGFDADNEWDIENDGSLEDVQPDVTGLTTQFPTLSFWPGEPSAAPEHASADVVALQTRIEEQLASCDDVDPGELRSAINQILADPSLQNVDVALWMEDWVGHTIMWNIPRSDPLVLPSIQYFRWAKRQESALSDTAHAVLERHKDRWFFRDLSKAHAHHAAFKDLMAVPAARPPWWEPQRAAGVRQLLKVVEDQHPTVMHDFNQDSLAYWQAILAEPQLPSNFWLLLLSAPIVLTIALVGTGAENGESLNPLWTYPIAFAAVTVGFWVKLAADRRSARRESAKVNWGRALPTMTASAILPFVAASLPSSAFTTAVAWTAAAVVTILCSAEFPAPDTDVSEDQAKSRNYFSIAGSVVAAVGAGVLPFGLWLQSLIPILAFAYLIARTSDTLIRAFEEFPPWLRTSVDFALILATGASGVAIGASLGGQPSVIALLAVPMLLIIQHPPTARLAVGVGRLSIVVWLASLVVGGWIERTYDDSWGWLLYFAMLSCSLTVVAVRTAKAFWYLDRPHLFGAAHIEK